MLDRKPVVEGVVSDGVVVGIADLLVDDGLEIRILCRVNLEAAGVEQVVGLGLRVAELFLERRHDLFDQLVRKIGERAVVFLCHEIHVFDPGVNIVSQGFLLILFGDFTLLVHVLEDDAALFLVVLLAIFRKRIEPRGVLGDAGDDRCLGKSQLRDVLVKIPLGRRLDAQGVVSEVDGIQIVLHDELFAHDLL